MMNTLTEETSLLHRMEDCGDAIATGEGGRLLSTYFAFSITLPVLIDVSSNELSDSELLIAAQKTGTFQFLDSPEEDIYNDLLKSE